MSEESKQRARGEDLSKTEKKQEKTHEPERSHFM